MVPKNAEKQRAIRLRKEGYTLSEIAKSLGVSKSSASIWLRNIDLSDEARERIDAKRLHARMLSAQTHRAKTRISLEGADALAKQTIKRTALDKNHFKMFAAIAYWCEGEKTENDTALTFANSDAALVQTFLFFLRNGFEIDELKFRVCMHLHSYHDEKKQRAFWSRATGIPAKQFFKSYQKAHTGLYKKDRYAGCASIRYHDVRVARELQAVARAILGKYGPIVQW